MKYTVKKQIGSLKGKKALILGIGGSGMNVLAQYLLSKEVSLWGMDRAFDQGQNTRILAILTHKGVNYQREDSDLKDIDFDFALGSPAIEESHPALLFIKSKKIPYFLRSEFLAEIFNDNRGIAVAGTSGKTTVTGMLGYILERAGASPQLLCGDEVINYSGDLSLGNFISGTGPMVFEADESDENFQKYCPYLGLINNIERDHHNDEVLNRYFSSFILKSDQLVINKDNERLSSLVHSLRKEAKSYSFKGQGDYNGKVLHVGMNSIHYEINGFEAKLNISGYYNVFNAVAALACSDSMGVSIGDGIKYLEDFKGILNRFTVQQVRDSVFVRDFAHNPDKLRWSVRSARALGKPLVFLFQPHGFGPMKKFAKDFFQVFVEEFSEKDEFILFDIYDAGGTADRSMNSKDYSNKMKLSYLRAPGHRDNWLKENDVLSSLRGKTVVLSGARDPSLSDFFNELTLKYSKWKS